MNDYQWTKHIFKIYNKELCSFCEKKKAIYVIKEFTSMNWINGNLLVCKDCDKLVKKGLKRVKL